MSRKEREQERKLTSLILTGLMLSNGTFLTPVAEAVDIPVTSAPSVVPGTILHDGKIYYPSNGNTWTLNYTGTDNAWAEIRVAGYYSGTGGGQFTLQNGKVQSAFGGYAGSAVSGCTLIIRGGEVTAGYSVCGGFTSSSGGKANGNTITIEGSPTLTDVSVFGGHSYYGAEAKNNTININAGVNVRQIAGGMAEGGGTVSGNTLNIGTTGITVGDLGVNGTQTINIGYTGHNVAFANNGKVLESSGKIDGVGTLDISGMTFGDTSGTMTLLSGTGTGTKATNFGSLTVKYGSITRTFDSTHTSYQIREGTPVDDDTVNNVTLAYRTGVGTVALNSGKNAVTYTHAAKSPVSSVSLGEITWGTGRTDGSSYTFNSSTTVDASNLTFTSGSKATSASMTLLSGASNIKNSTATKNITLDANFNDANGVNWVGTATNGEVISSSTAGTIKYNITGGTASSINLNGWSSGTLSFLSGWSGTGIAVDTGSFTATPTTGTILTAPTGSSFGEVTGAKKYASGEAFS